MGVLLSVGLIRSNAGGAGRAGWTFVFYAVATWPLALALLSARDFRGAAVVGGASMAALSLIGALAGALLFLPSGVALLVAGLLPRGHPPPQKPSDDASSAP